MIKEAMFVEFQATAKNNLFDEKEKVALQYF